MADQPLGAIFREPTCLARSLSPAIIGGYERFGLSPYAVLLTNPPLLQRSSPPYQRAKSRHDGTMFQAVPCVHFLDSKQRWE